MLGITLKHPSLQAWLEARSHDADIAQADD